MDHLLGDKFSTPAAKLSHRHWHAIRNYCPASLITHFAGGLTMVILARIKVRPVNSEGTPEPMRRTPLIQCRKGDEQDLRLHAVLMERLGFSSPKIQRLLSNAESISLIDSNDP
jgi:hypothetical protein